MARDRVATYRLQFRNGMDFDRAAGLVPYLKRLGVSHLYASPLFTAAAGSTHGYDVADYNAFDPVLGGREAFERLSAALKDADIGLMLDIVPNHMAASPENPWWRDVAEWGPRARHAGHFDIDWTRRLTLPILGGGVDEIIAAGELRIGIDEENRGLVLGYYETAYPLTPPSYAVLSRAMPDCPPIVEVAEMAQRATPETSEDFHATMRSRLPDDTIAGALETLSSDPALMTRLLDAQPWQLTDWREARRDLSYRRFFEVTGLVGTRVEDPPVFDDVHRLTLELVAAGHVDGLRVDHVDGLSDPAAYLKRLREAVGPDVWILVEKILEVGEPLPDWPIEGTTGYEFIGAMSDLFHARDGAEVLESAYAGLTVARPAAQRRDAAKRLMVTQNFEGELSRLMALLVKEAPDHEETSLREALVALIVALPVYRTYGDPNGFSDEDVEVLRPAASVAAEAAGASAVEAVIEALSAPQAWEFRARFQQLTGPAMAKAVEDTLFYRHTALLADNEVGCDPVVPPGRSVDVHRTLAVRGRRQPHGLNTTSTHDTKRGEDARARLYSLAAAPADWISAVERWRGWAAGSAAEAPEAAIEWTIYQALAGIWPDGGHPDDRELASMSERFTGFLVKAMREAKLQTSWTEEDAAYEETVTGYARALLDPSNRRFIDDFDATLAPYREAGRVMSLAQTLVKLTAPGVPDIYQGSEAGDFSLVDPDNRRPPDFAAISDRLATPPADWPGSLADLKTRILRVALADRRRRPMLYSSGQYEAVEIEGPMARSLFAFVREHDGERRVVLVPIRGTLPPQAAGGSARDEGWADTTIALPPSDGAWTELFTGETVSAGRRPVADFLARFPVALFTSEPHG